MDVDTGADGSVPEVPMVLIGNSSDVGWKYGKYCDPLNKSKVKCDFCGHISTGGIYRFKKHIVGVENVVASCKKATPEAKEACKKALEKVTATKGIKRQHEQDLRDDVHISSSVGEGVSTSEPNKVGPTDKFVRPIDGKSSKEEALRQLSMNEALFKERVHQTSQYVARWVYTHAIPFNALDNDEFKQMCEAIGKFGPGYEPPSQFDLREKLLTEEYARTKSLLDDREKQKNKLGCTIMTDAWTDMKRRSIMNVCMHCSGGTSFLKSKETSDVSHTGEVNHENRAAFIKMLVDIFVGNSKNRSIRKLAGEALAKLCIQDGSNTSIILQVNGDVLGSLTKILLQDDAENKTCRIRAAAVLEQMCVHHTQDRPCLSKLKEAMTDTMPKVLAQILSRGPAKDETHARTEEDQVGEVDIENQCGENGRDKTSSTRPQNNEDYEDEVHVEVEENESENDEDEDFQAPLLSLCVTICDTFISTDQDLSCHFDAFSLPRKLEDMLAENSIPTVHCLRLMKLTCKMVISMMKHSRSNYLKEELESLTEALSRASESMSLLDMSMVFASKDDGAATTMKPVRSLCSLVKEAKEIVATHFKAHEIKNMQAVTSADG